MNFNSSEKTLSNLAIPYSLLIPTETGLKKSIIDAIFSLRIFFKEKNYHDYSTQKQGEDNKTVREATIVESDKLIKTKVSLYRPNTKKGDPRIWIYKLSQHCKYDEKIALIIKDEKLFIINISKFDLQKIIENKIKDNIIYEFLISFTSLNSVAIELFEKLKIISSKGFLKAGTGDKEVGELLERELNIRANSSKNPDYKGIELKAKHNLNTRSNLFAQVPNYKHPLSKIKKITEIADRFGYIQNGYKVLRNTTCTTKANSQGLKFNIDYDKEILFETTINDNNFENFAVWEFEILIKRLSEKHKQTFWIEAEKKIINNITFFHYKDVTYTSNPNSHLLIDLISRDIITMDHLISVKKKNDGFQRIEKGPLFKIKPNNINLLIPTVKKFNLS